MAESRSSAFNSERKHVPPHALTTAAYVSAVSPTLSRLRISAAHFFSPDGKSIASGAGGDSLRSSDHTLKIWDAWTGACNYTLRGHSNLVMCCAFSPDGQSVLSGSDDKTLKIWSAIDGSERYTLMSVGFSPKSVGIPLFPHILATTNPHESTSTGCAASRDHNT